MTLKEHIDDIRDRLERGEFPPNEAAVCDDIVRRIVHELGWPRYESQVVYPQYPVEGGQVDFALCHPPSEPRVFIEVKRLGNIEGAEEQLFRYAFRRGVPIAILTDGQKWQFFYSLGQGDYRERKVHELDLIQEDSEGSAKRFNRYLKYESIRTGEAVEAIQEDHEKRQVAIRLPETWSRLLEDRDKSLLRAVAEKMDSLYRYKLSDEQTLNFLRNLNRTETDPVPIATDPPNRGGEGRSRYGRFLLVVTLPNGERIDHGISTDTFVEVIEKLGIERVRRLEIKNNRIPLISPSNHPTYFQRKSGPYYIMTSNNTATKKRLLEEIGRGLGESLEVGLVERS